MLLVAGVACIAQGRVIEGVAVGIVTRRGLRDQREVEGRS